MGIVPKYAIGQQDFKSLRLAHCVYIDKTEYIKKIISSGSQYYFLARPRRFGKSLFLSMLRYFFEGERNLFKGLYIDSVDWDWKQYPVLYLDLNRERYAEAEKLNSILDNLFSKWESKYEVAVIANDLSSRLSNIIESAHRKTGRQVVILVDEYDKPLVGNLNKKENFEYYQNQLASIYSNFKSSAEHIRLVFLTGVSRFSKLSVFSDLNNIADITFSNEFADICGITEKEMLDNLKSGIKKLAQYMETTFDIALNLLKENYDGYRFAERGSDIYNPWSLLNAMDTSKIDNYWNETGVPTITIEALKRVNADLEKTFDSYCSSSDLKGLDLLDPNPRALLYQTGYLTIKGYNAKLNRFHLGIPNREAKEALVKVLIPAYLKYKSVFSNEVTDKIVVGFAFGEPEEAMKALQAYFAGIDYSLRIDNENNFHNAFFLLMDLIGLNAKVESHTSNGRIDIELTTDEYIYIIELKYDYSAQEALEQIERKQYARKYHADSRKIFLIGATFSSKTRCIEEWLIKELQ
ncbi:MAG: ATP-binding protein [Muribaculaceae bacterium]|nr:ATP-binding protein [Muribaculaceae bacterium]